jgi:hypothetical protein
MGRARGGVGVGLMWGTGRSNELFSADRSRVVQYVASVRGTLLTRQVACATRQRCRELSVRSAGAVRVELVNAWSQMCLGRQKGWAPCYWMAPPLTFARHLFVFSIWRRMFFYAILFFFATKFFCATHLMSTLLFHLDFNC